MKTEKPVKRWAIKWRSGNKTAGKQEHLMWGFVKGLSIPYLCHTRAEARVFIEERFGYIRNRPDLCKEPHGWKMPIPVKVDVVLTERTGG